MNISYIRIEDPPDAMSDTPGLIGRIIGWLLPKASPDFENLYPRVVYWFLELTASKPTREIGFDRAGAPIVFGPAGRNYGLWTDSPVLFESADYPAIAKDEFESIWDSLVQDADIGS